MYTIIGGVRSRTLRVLWMLEELEQPYTHQPAAPRSDEVTALYPAGKVPVLVVDGTPLTDSTAILTFLADRHSALTYPAGTLDRARQDGHTQFLLDELDALLWTASRHSFILPEELRVSAIKDSLKWEYERSLQRLESRLGDGPYLMGDTMTVPDIIAAHCAGWAVSANFPEPSARLQDYFDGLRGRDAFRRAMKN
ncbi:MAG: glutathione S-transferase family protein [Rhodobacter sp.]|nr:glutathione S-transferase family protein [Rhodobacter sp.]